MKHQRHALVFFLVILLLETASLTLLAGDGPLSANEFQQRILEWSEDPGYFDTDNFISNEPSYLHVVPLLLKIAPSSQAYIGVGPDQNFSYIAHLKPKIAIILDIRRDNLLQHLYFKELFRVANDRWEYLSYLFAKPMPAEIERDPAADAKALASRFREIDSSETYFEENFARFWESLQSRFPRLVRESDEAIFYRMASAFFRMNLDLKFQSHQRYPRPFYPNYEDLMTAADKEGRLRHYLNNNEAFEFLKRMQDDNRLLPVVGDFGEGKALRAVGDYLRQRGYVLAAFYVSNVEFYLLRSGRFSRFAASVAGLPINSKSVFIRSYFSYWREHPETMPGHYVTSLLQYMDRFIGLNEKQPYQDYWDVVMRDYIPAPSLLP